MTCAINKAASQLSVIWDLGRRCTYSCSYCGPHHSNKTSPIVSFDTLKSTLDGVAEYHRLYNEQRTRPIAMHIDFTGGEPTINPNFFKFIEYAHDMYSGIIIGLTTNGCYSLKQCQTVIKTTNNCTVSYHPEASPAEKSLVLANINLMKEKNYRMKVNVMFHKDYFDECVKLTKDLKSKDIKFVPRLIGDSNNKEDIKLGYSHVYNQKQMQWFKDYWTGRQSKVNEKAKANKLGANLGRPCCRGIQLDVYDTKWNKTEFIPNNNFFNWHCTVNWEFLYINSELDAVWHHQTCQVNLDNNTDPIGKASNFVSINKKMAEIFATGKMPVIRCPRTWCGCGLCAPKSNDKEIFKELFSKQAKLTPVFQKENKEPITRSSVIKMLKDTGVYNV